MLKNSKCNAKDTDSHLNVINGVNTAIAKRANPNPDHNKVQVLDMTDKYLPRLIKDSTEIQK